MRRPRTATGGLAYYVLSRAVGRMTLFESDVDCAAFERCLADVPERLPCRLLSYCLMPNHWHLVLWPRRDGELSEFLRLLIVTHTQRWRGPSHGGHRPALLRAVRKLPDRAGPTPADGLPVRRAQSAAGQAGQLGGGLAMGQFAPPRAADDGPARMAAADRPVAGGGAGGLGG
ncbi:MAG TPA: hypothetical protein VGN72_13380 [Tepidisphaeraceae bacterium]|jgi:REP element-mobilizing transposase RayT|nr:hypothetical protein [Tepidisphaeraceae bacterium]